MLEWSSMSYSASVIGFYEPMMMLAFWLGWEAIGETRTFINVREEKFFRWLSLSIILFLQPLPCLWHASFISGNVIIFVSTALISMTHHNIAMPESRQRWIKGVLDLPQNCSWFLRYKTTNIKRNEATTYLVGEFVNVAINDFPNRTDAWVRSIKLTDTLAYPCLSWYRPINNYSKDHYSPSQCPLVNPKLLICVACVTLIQKIDPVETEMSETFLVFGA